MEHRGMGRIRIDPVGASRRNDFERWLVGTGIAHLHRTGMRAQQQAALDVERVVHRARRMVLWLIERREIVPIGLDLRAIGKVESNRTKDRFNALPGADNGMDSAATAAAPGK